MPTDPKNYPKKFTNLQVCTPNAEARKIKQYAKRKGISVGKFLRRIAAAVIDANTTTVI